jgi:hypothetical protein
MVQTIIPQINPRNPGPGLEIILSPLSLKACFQCPNVWENADSTISYSNPHLIHFDCITHTAGE